MTKIFTLGIKNAEFSNHCHNLSRVLIIKMCKFHRSSWHWPNVANIKAWKTEPPSSLLLYTSTYAQIKNWGFTYTHDSTRSCHRFFFSVSQLHFRSRTDGVDLLLNSANSFISYRLWKWRNCRMAHKFCEIQ